MTIRHRHINEAVLVIVIISLLICIGGWINGLATLQEDNLRADSKIDSTIVDSLEDNPEVSVIVLLKNPDTPGDIHRIQSEVLESNPEFKVEHRYSSINGFSGTLDEDTLNKLRFNSEVEKIYLNKVFHINLDESVPLINADNVWEAKTNNVNLTGKYETACVVDTGVNYNHPALAGRIINGWDYVNNDSDAMDDNSHGTHVAGIIASNDSVYKGVAPDAQIVAIKVCNSGGDCTSENVLSGIDWCISNSSVYNISVIVLSLGDNGEYNSSNCPTDFDSSINSAVSHGILVAISSGNNYFEGGISSPACSPNATSVGAVDENDVFWETSNKGTNLDLLAPGVNIISSVLNGFGSKSGTSMATPHVAGAALLMNQNKRLKGESINASDTERKLKATGANKTFYSTTNITTPRINVEEAVLISKLIASHTTNPYPRTDTNLNFYGNYTNRTSNNPILSANCTLTVNGSVNSMVYNATVKAYQYSKNFSTDATYSYSIKCNQSSFETLIAENDIEVVEKSENCTYPGSNIDWNLTGSDYSSCVMENLIINQSDINILENSKFILKDTNITLIGASAIYLINVSNSANFTLDNVIVKGMDTNTKRLDVNIYGVGDITNTTFENSVLTILGNKSHTITDSTFKYRISLEENSSNEIFNSTFHDYSYFEDSSNNIINNSTFNGRVLFGESGTNDNSVNTIINSLFKGDMFILSANAIVNFTEVASNMNATLRIQNNPKIYGLIDMPDTATMLSNNLTRYYPVYIYHNGTTTAYADKQVNITDKNGNLIWQGTTNSAGYVEPNLTLNTTNYGIGNFTISVNESEEIGLLTDTPITLEALYTPPATPLSTNTGGSNPDSCYENWSCTNWGECISSLKIRTCNDINDCGTEDYKPSFSQVCIETDVTLEKGSGTGNTNEDDEIVILNPSKNNCCLFGICWFKYIICWYWWILLLLIMIIATISLWFINERKNRHLRRALIKALSG